MRSLVTLVVTGVEPGSQVEQDLRQADVALLGARGPNLWLLGEVESGFFASDEKRARILAERLAAALPQAQAVAYEYQDQHGRARGHLLGDRWSPPPGLGSGMFAVGDEVRWGQMIEDREGELARELRTARKEAKRAGRDPDQVTAATLPSAFEPVEGHSREQLIGMRSPAPQLSDLSEAATSAGDASGHAVDHEL